MSDIVRKWQRDAIGDRKPQDMAAPPDFDRFIAKVKAAAWDEGMEAGQRAVILKEFTPTNPYQKDENDE